MNTAGQCDLLSSCTKTKGRYQGGKLPALPAAAMCLAAVGGSREPCRQLLCELLGEASWASLRSGLQLVAELVLVAFEGNLNSDLVYLRPDSYSRSSLPLLSLAFFPAPLDQLERPRTTESSIFPNSV